MCSNSLVVDMHLADETVLHAVTRDVLDPEVVAAALDLALRELEQPSTTAGARVDALKSELARLEAELSRYGEAIADAGPLETILRAVKVREQRRDAPRELARDGTPGCRRGARALACGARQQIRLHARNPTARAATTEGPRPEAAVHLRAEGRGVTLRTYRGVNFCKFDGGPKAI